MDALGTAALKWRFAHCLFDESTLELSCGGQLVELERKPLEVLRHLLRHAGEVVTKEELHAAVWPGRLLSDTVLTKAVSRIREVLADDAQTLIKTVHGYGYRLIAPVSIEAAAPQRTAPRLGLKAGDAPPLRAQWKLVEHLGSGGSGEVWKVVHAKTGDVRVYKFALDAEALNTLKREITLFRLLRQQLGPEAPIAEMLDWNLEEAPYFLELECYAAGNLVHWAEAQGGLGKISLDLRLGVFADLAEGLARVHGVGVLHKDLKASNVLIALDGSRVRPLLADFGGGGVLADEVIANAGITRMGFTQGLEDALHGTTLYVAPEVLEGQPQTIRGDVYALGVLLYQLCVGDFRKPLAPGWELTISDELLRSDIADAVQGDPERRLASAQTLAERIRTLDARRVAHVAALAASARRQRNEAALERFRQRRWWMLGVIAALTIGLGIAAVQYRRVLQEQQRAEAAARTALDSGRFMIESMLPGYDGGVQAGTRNLSVKDLLDAAARAADAKLADRPEIAFHVRIALANAYNQIEGGVAAAKQQELLSHAALRAVLTEDPKRALQLIPAEGLWIAGPDDLPLVQALLGRAEEQPKLDGAVRLGLLGSNSDAEFRYGSLQKARRLAAEAEAQAGKLGDESNLEDNLAFRIRLAREDADFVEAVRLTPAYERVVQNADPPSPLNRAYFVADRGITALLQGRIAAAAPDLAAGFRDTLALQPDSNFYSRYVSAYHIALEAQQGVDGRLIGARARRWFEIMDAMAPGEPDMAAEALVVAEAAWQSGARALAAQMFERLAKLDRVGTHRCIANWARLDLALLSIEAGDAGAARRWLAAVDAKGWSDYRPGHPREAVEALVRGRLALLEGRAAEAGPLLQKAGAELAAIYAPGYWRLAQAKSPR